MGCLLPRAAEQGLVENMPFELGLEFQRRPRGSSVKGCVVGPVVGEVGTDIPHPRS